MYTYLSELMLVKSKMYEFDFIPWRTVVNITSCEKFASMLVFSRNSGFLQPSILSP
jgi:hypothetical protein